MQSGSRRSERAPGRRSVCVLARSGEKTNNVPSEITPSFVNKTDVSQLPLKKQNTSLLSLQVPELRLSASESHNLRVLELLNLFQEKYSVYTKQMHHRDLRPRFSWSPHKSTAWRQYCRYQPSLGSLLHRRAKLPGRTCAKSTQGQNSPNISHS